MEEAGDVIGGGHNIEDPHAAAALAADGDVDGEDAGEEAGPADAARSGGGLGGGRVVVVVVEAQGELLAGGGDDGRGEDAGAEVMTAGEDAEIAGHVKAGRRDELAGHPPTRAPAEVLGDRPALLRWIFEHTMGAREAFAHRAAELRADEEPAGDADVVDSFLADVAPGGMLAEYLGSACLAHRSEGTLFVHGGVTARSLGMVPGRAHVDGVERWIEALNEFYREQLAAFMDQRMDDGIPAWTPIVDYQAPIPGTAMNQASVVYGRLADAHNDPRLPEPVVVGRLRRAGIHRLVVGHTPVGDVPAVLRRDGFTLVMADNSYGRLEAGGQVVLERNEVRWSGRCRLDDGTEVDVSAAIDERPSPVGSVTSDGRLVKAPLAAGWLLFRALPQRRVEQVAVAEHGSVAPPDSLG